MPETFKNYHSLTRLLKLSLPIIATQFSHMAMGVSDTIMSGHASTEDLAAVAIGTSLWIPIFLFLSGTLSAITPTIAHFNGENTPQEIAPSARQSLWIALLLAIFAFLFLQHVHPILQLMEVQKDIQPIIEDYLKAISWGMGGLTLFLVARYINEGMANTIPIMIVGFIGLIINIFFNYILIFGHFGFQAMGGVGAGWATMITQWLMAIMLIGYLYLSPRFQHLELFKLQFWPHWDCLFKLMKLGIPIGIAVFVEGSIFSVIALFVASLGTVMVASHQIALSVSSLLFVIPLSFSMGLTILVAHANGAKNYSELKQTVKTGYALTASLAIMAAGFIIFYAESIAGLYTGNPRVIELAAQMMILAGLFQISDAIQLCSGGALRGLKDTTTPMVFSIFSFWVLGFPLGYLLGLSDFIVPAMGAPGFWVGLLIGLSISAVLLTTRLVYQVRHREYIQSQ